MCSEGWARKSGSACRISVGAQRSELVEGSINLAFGFGLQNLQFDTSINPCDRRLRSVRCSWWFLDGSRTSYLSTKTECPEAHPAETGSAGTSPSLPGRDAPCVARHTWTRPRLPPDARQQHLRCVGSAQIRQNPQPRACPLR